MRKTQRQYEQKYLAKLRTDPIKYEAYLVKRRAIKKRLYPAAAERLRADPEKYRIKKEKARQYRAQQWANDPEGERVKSRRRYHDPLNIEKNRALSREANKRRTRDPLRWPAKVLAHIRGRCRKDDIPFNLVSADIVIPEVCPVLGTPFVLGLRTLDKDGRGPSIDRHIPALGYVKGNVSVISRRANFLKSDCTSGDELRKVAVYIDSINGAP